MPGLPALRRNAMIVVVLLGLSGTAVAQGGLEITRLRTPKVTLLNCDSGAREGDSVEKNLSPPPPNWPVEKHFSEKGLLQIKVGGKDYCVRAYSVETNRALTLPKTDCKAMVAANQPRSGATRGVGEECK